MRVIKFREGEKVAVIRDNILKVGVIRNMYVDLKDPIAVVEFEDNEIVKVPVEDIAPYDQVKEDNIEEPVEKTEITITPEEFHDITTNIIAEECRNMGILGYHVSLAISLIMSKIHKALFIDGADND